MDMALKALLVLAAGCSVPAVSLEGKDCPCAGNFQCGADMKCHAVLSDGGKQDVMHDTPPGGSCLGSSPGASLYSDGFDGALAFQTNGGTWSQSASALSQTNATSGLAFAHTLTAATNTATERVVVAMTGMTPGTAMGIAVRVTAGQKGHYDCLWEPGSTGALLIQQVNNGGGAQTIGSKTGLASSLAVTMEVHASGNTIQCCIDGVAGATLTATDTNGSFPSGLPGVSVNDMKASFTQLDVYSN